jgi:hypothetical protein
MRMDDEGPSFPEASIALSDSTEIGRLVVEGGGVGTAVVVVGGGSVVTTNGLDVAVDPVVDE